MESNIIKRAISGDSEALAILIDKHKNIAYDLAFGIVKNEEDAKDITQDSFLKVLENVDGFRNESKFSTWLYRIVYNQSIAFIKKSNKYESLSLENVSSFEHLDNTDIIEDSHKELHRAIDHLENTERNIIMLFYIGSKSIKQIAKITGLSISNIKVILHRTRKKLYNKLENEKRK